MDVCLSIPKYICKDACNVIVMGASLLTVTKMSYKDTNHRNFLKKTKEMGFTNRSVYSNKETRTLDL